MSGQLPSLLDERRRALGMSRAMLARRAHVSVPTLNRLLHGKEKNPTYATLRALADALGVEIRIGGPREVVERCSAAEFREEAAKRKAEKLVGLVQGNSALESQAVDASRVADMVRQSVHVLLAGSPRRLWAE